MKWKKRWESELLTSWLPPQTPSVRCVCMCLILCACKDRRIEWIIDEGVNRKRKALELSECARACVYVSCRFYAGRDIQCRQMGNYQAGDRQSLCHSKNHKCICLEYRFCHHGVGGVHQGLDIKLNSCFPGMMKSKGIWHWEKSKQSYNIPQITLNPAQKRLFYETIYIGLLNPWVWV